MALPPIIGPATEPHSNTITKIAVAPASSEMLNNVHQALVNAQIRKYYLMLHPKEQEIKYKYKNYLNL